MSYALLALLFIVILCVAGLFLRFASLSEEYRQEVVKDDDHTEYYREKHRKIKDQYYRSVDLEKFNVHVGSDPRIVEIAKPQGRWTSMVIRRNMHYMMTLKNLMGDNLSKLGIWQLKVKAQSLISHGMHKGRGK